MSGIVIWCFFILFDDLCDVLNVFDACLIVSEILFAGGDGCLMVLDVVTVAFHGFLMAV